MVAPSKVAEFHADYDRHPDDRVRLFRAIADFVPDEVRALYPGSYVDIAPSVWFDDVTYVDLDKRAATFFAQEAAVAALVDEKRSAVGRPSGAKIAFHHQDYQTPLREPEQSFDLLVSLYAGFISEHCSDHLKVGGVLLANPSHGDAAMASIDPRYELCAVVTSSGGDYAVKSEELDSYLVPKKEQEISVESLHASGRGVAYTRSPFAYLFRRVR